LRFHVNGSIARVVGVRIVTIAKVAPHSNVCTATIYRQRVFVVVQVRFVYQTGFEVSENNRAGILYSLIMRSLLGIGLSLRSLLGILYSLIVHSLLGSFRTG
jgi:hypothetical protein